MAPPTTDPDGVALTRMVAAGDLDRIDNRVRLLSPLLPGTERGPNPRFTDRYAGVWQNSR